MSGSIRSRSALQRRKGRVLRRRVKETTTAFSNVLKMADIARKGPPFFVISAILKDL